jgi:hypothetical protein
VRLVDGKNKIKKERETLAENFVKFYVVEMLGERRVYIFFILGEHRWRGNENGLLKVLGKVGRDKLCASKKREIVF